MTEVLVAHLLALRAHIDAMLATMGVMPERPTETEEPCPHPEGQREYAKGTMGSPRQFTCKVCDETVTEPNAPAGAGV